MGASESVDLLTCRRNAGEVRERCGVDAEELRSRCLAGEADIRDRHPVAMTEASRFPRTEMDFERGQRLSVPMSAPRNACRLVDPELVLQIFTDPRYDQRMGIACHDLRQAAHPRPAARILGQQWRVGARLIKILDDSERFEQ